MPTEAIAVVMSTLHIIVRPALFFLAACTHVIIKNEEGQRFVPIEDFLNPYSNNISPWSNALPIENVSAKTRKGRD
jgi:hypothetical protein